MIKIENILDYLNKIQIEFKYYGRNDVQINEVSLPDNIKENSIIWVKDPNLLEKYRSFDMNNLLFVSSFGYDIIPDKLNILFSDNSKELFFSIIANYFNEVQQRSGIGSSSTVKTFNVGSDISIGENCFIGSNVIIGNNVVIKNNVVIENSVLIGNDCIIFSGAVIGSDGYGYFKNKAGLNVKVPHIGGIRIGNNVEIGANTCIDRGTIGDTIIGNNVKIDNLCHIAHNVIIEDNVNVIALSMIAGSVVLKENSYVAPSAAIKNQLTVGKNSIVGLGAVVVKDVEDNVVVAGVPAKIIKEIDIK